MLDGINSSSIPQSRIYKMEEMNFESLKEMVLFCEIDLQDGRMDGYLSNDQYKEFSEGCVAAKQEENKALSAELKDKAKPPMGIDESIKEPTLADENDDFHTNPKENTYIMERGYKILYKDGKYSMPDRADLGSNPNIYHFLVIIASEHRDKTTTTYKSAMQNATTNQEKRNAIDALVEDLRFWHNNFSEDYLKANYKPGAFKIAGLTIKYSVSEEYTPIVDKEFLYKQAGCFEE